MNDPSATERTASAGESRRPTRIVPHQLYGAPGVTRLADEGHSAILFKRLAQPLYDQPIFARSASLTVLQRGRKEIILNDAGAEVLRPGDTLFLRPDLFGVSDLYSSKDGAFEQYLLFYDRELLLEFLRGFRIRLKCPSPPAACRGKLSAPLTAYLQGLASAFVGLRRPARILRLKLLESLELLQQADESRTFVDWLFHIVHGAARNLRQVMEANFDRGLAVEDFALLSGRSLSTFQRDFKKLYGGTPGKWLQAKRLEKARTLLGAGTTVTDAAMQIGYENISHFIRLFRRAYGLSPAEFARRRAR